MSLTRPELFGRSASHFTRLPRMIALEAGVDLAFRPTGDLRGLEPDDHGGHPGLKLPTLVIDGRPVFGATTICRRIVEASPDGFVLTWPEAMSLDLQSGWELLMGAMLAQVQLVFGVTVTGLPADHLYFVKAARGLDGSLGWLDERLADLLGELPPGALSLFEAALFCQLEHLRFRPTVPLQARPNLDAFRQTFGARPSALATPYRLDAPASETPLA